MDEVFDRYYQLAGNIFAAEDTFWEGEEEVFPADQSAFARHEEQNGRSPLHNREKKNRVNEVFQYYQSPGNILATEDTFWVGEEVFPASQRAFVGHEEQSGRSPLQNRMDEVFQYYQSAGNTFATEDKFWVGEGVFPANRSAFVGYKAGRAGGGSRGKTLGAKRNYQNVNKRMIEFMRRRWIPVAEGEEYERERCRRHMINERMRREKQKNSYSSLRSLLPPRTKSDKNSIIQEAAKEVKELQRHREELDRRNREIEGILAERERGKKNEGAKIKLRVANPTSGVDSMVEVLKCLKNMGSKTGAVQSNFSAQEFSAKEAAEVEKVVQRTLFEVERKLLFHFPN
ncbi:hypothetical protein RHSIM_Rhsim02G0032900 [Rhododendron simsii]|uniref:BHLH domain-containing protein n=1 Tax=Rhododendron simsii TaxID=118357 RepID=A0A834LSW3_RHOSS|nr:hypothetical protein RHSIM_Rhsim02G0032900 [Rhododendron simsii]